MDSPSRAVYSASKSRPRPRRAGVRVVAKIRPQTASEVTGPPQISILRPDGDLPSIVFADRESSRKDSYKMDWCYGQDEGVGEIFYREVNPLHRGDCHGSNACVISYGPRESGKTEMIQGSEENPGLAPMAVFEILSHAEELGGSVSVSCYEVCQDRVYDLLEPKEQEVLILEDAARKVQLKGLSLVPVKSISDFKKLYFHELDKRKQSDKRVSDVVTRRHRGLIVYVTCAHAKKPNVPLVGKMNFVDLAGYDDVKRNTNIRPQLAESAKVNKSLYALLNVVSALNSDGSYVSYRESKLTRLLQDFLCDGNAAVLITCLNSTLSQDTIHAVSLASRSCQATIQHLRYSTHCGKGTPKIVPSSSLVNSSPEKRIEVTPFVTMRRHQRLRNSVQKPVISLSRLNDKKTNHTPSTTKGRPQPLQNSVQKLTSTLSRLNDKKASHSPTVMEGRKLFNAASPISRSAQDIFSPNATTTMSTPKRDIYSPNATTVMNTPKRENPLLHCNSVASTITQEDRRVSYVASSAESSVSEADVRGSYVANGVESSVSEVDVSGSYVANGVEFSVSEVDMCGSNFAESVEPSVSEMDICGSYVANGVDSSDSETEHGSTSYVAKNVESSASEAEHGSTSYVAKNVESSASEADDSSPQLVNLSIPQVDVLCSRQLDTFRVDPKTPDISGQAKVYYNTAFEDTSTPQEIFRVRSTGLKKTLVQECLTFLNTANKEDLKKLKGIGDKRADYILQLREREKEPFKEINNLKDLGLNSKQIKEMVTMTLGEFSG